MKSAARLIGIVAVTTALGVLTFVVTAAPPAFGSEKTSRHGWSAGRLSSPLLRELAQALALL